MLRYAMRPLVQPKSMFIIILRDASRSNLAFWVANLAVSACLDCAWQSDCSKTTRIGAGSLNESTCVYTVVLKALECA